MNRSALTEEDLTPWPDYFFHLTNHFNQMGKRMTDTAKWDKLWFRTLPLHLKLLWLFICDRCDQAGVWNADFGTASFMIGAPVTETELVKHFGAKLKKISETEYWIPTFIEFQCGTLSLKSPAHKPIFKLIEKHKLKLPELNAYRPPTETTGALFSDDVLPDRAVVETELFGDEQYIYGLTKDYPNVNLRKAFTACWRWHIELPNPPRLPWMWRQKFSSWCGREKPEAEVKTKSKPKHQSNAENLARDFIGRSPTPDA